MTILPPAGVDSARRRSALDRRGRIIDALSKELDASDPTSSAARFAALLGGEPRMIVASGDVDGLVSAAMLARVCDWRVSVLVISSEYVLVHPDVAGNLDLTECFGVDVFSSYMDNVSNHAVLYGRKRPLSNADAAAAARAYDQVIRERGRTHLFANASFWAEIEGAQGGSTRPHAHVYRYPLGTAQLLLAMLEVIDRSPRLFDLEYLPWLVANCDGGLDTIREYAFNVPMWWSCLAAAVGPASLSEALFQLASTQRPNQFLGVVHQLRSEGAGVAGWVSDYLDDDWNIPTPSTDAFIAVLDWLTRISGWPDPLAGGMEGLPDWRRVELTDRGLLLIDGLPLPEDDLPVRLAEFKRQLRSALDAFHMGFSYYETKALTWERPWAGAHMPALPPLPAELA
jgi:hypothetical protein